MENLNKLKLPDSYKNFLEILYAILQKDKRIDQLFLFGSCSKGTLHEGSDIDIAVITKEKLSNIEELSFYDYLLDIDPKYYVACDLLIMSRQQFDEYKHLDGYVQKYILRDGVELNEPIRASM